MATPLTDNALVSRRNVAVEIGVLRPPPVTNRYIPACVVGCLSAHAPSPGDARPGQVIRRASGVTTTSGGDRVEVSIEHLRFTAGQNLSLLPGLDGVEPSLIRDSVQLLLDAGASFVDVLLGQITGRSPYDLDDPLLIELLSGDLDEMQGALLIYPDAGGPVSVRPRPAADPNDRLQRLLDLVKRQSLAWSERHQIALFDAPDVPAEELTSFFDRCGSADALMCRWEGEPTRLAAHGWRSAAAVVAGASLLHIDDLASTTVGFPVNLGPGRAVHADRRDRLAAPPRRAAPPPGLPLTTVRLHPKHDTATVEGDLSLRRPAGAWTLPALRTAKAIHYVIRRATEPFVFRPVQGMELYALTSALTLALEPYQISGVLTGPDGEGGPDINGVVIRDADTPGFLIDVAAQLRPWCHQVRMKVTLHQNQEPSVSLSA
ncbi:MAG: hypothetical protein JNM72_25005 [Deltaproteobacteria bacterium]|jgi:hypothetical protein|nr:hypothetical protein [Deltaproteobacteria bacterium]